MRPVLFLLVLLIGFVAFPDSNVAKYLSSKGYQLVYLEIITDSNYNKYLVAAVESGYNTYYYVTKDVPYGLSSYSLPKGFYYCKTGYLSIYFSISELIDADGSVVQFSGLTTWKDLPR